MEKTPENESSRQCPTAVKELLAPGTPRRAEHDERLAAVSNAAAALKAAIAALLEAELDLSTNVSIHWASVIRSSGYFPDIARLMNGTLDRLRDWARQ